MYESFYGFKEKPFSILPDLRFLYMSKRHAKAYAMLEYSLMNDIGIVVISGEIGSGKTTLVQHFLHKVDSDTIIGIINNTQPDMGHILRWVLLAFGLEHSNKNQVEQYELFYHYLEEQNKRGMRSILVVDEAQNLSLKMLEELRMLTNVNFDNRQLLQLILVGQPELNEKLKQPALKQFAQRIAVNVHLKGLSMEETVEYIHHRTKIAGSNKDIFTYIACKNVFLATKGIPRLINILCDTALVYSYAETKKTIDYRLMQEVIKDKTGSGMLDLTEI